MRPVLRNAPSAGLTSKGLMVIGLVVAAAFFVPAAKVDEALRAAPEPDGQYTGLYTDPGKVISYKSGLRIAVEGRLKWLGIL